MEQRAAQLALSNQKINPPTKKKGAPPPAPKPKEVKSDLTNEDKYILHVALKTVAKFMGMKEEELSFEGWEDDLHYHESWDWLMPVIAKLSKQCNIVVGIKVTPVDDGTNIRSVFDEIAKLIMLGVHAPVLEHITAMLQPKKS